MYEIQNANPAIQLVENVRSTDHMPILRNYMVNSRYIYVRLNVTNTKAHYWN
jgi:hypothetical protein